MTTILWRPEVNALTTPLSYRIQAVPRGTVGYAEMAAAIAATHPNYTKDIIQSLAPLMMEWIQQQLINGWNVTFPNAFAFHVSFTGKLDSPDDPLPESDDLLQINARVSRSFIREVRHTAKFERLPMTEKVPVISSIEDTKLKLADVLFADGVLKLTGSNLDFDESRPDCGCVIEGTRSGKLKQSTYASVTNSAILLVPDIPAQTEPWQNEYRVAVSTQYSEHGTLRTGSYRRRLRSPLTVTGLGHPHPQETGILTGGTAAAPYVKITGGIVSADTLLRIQAVIDSRSGQLLLNLLDMQEGGSAGAAVIVAANWEYTLPGFSDSAVSSLSIRVDNYAALKELIRNSYAGRLTDILDVKAA